MASTGQVMMHSPQPTQMSGSMKAASPTLIAPWAHHLRHSPQATQGVSLRVTGTPRKARDLMSMPI